MFLIIGPADILIVVIVFLLFFGGKKIPDLAKGFGEGIRNFKKSVKTDEKPENEEKLN